MDLHILQAGQFVTAAIEAMSGKCRERQMQPLMLITPTSDGERERPATALSGVVAALSKSTNHQSAIYRGTDGQIHEIRWLS